MILFHLLIKINDPLMASTMGCTLMTKRSNAENVIGKHDDLVIEPYANPFRVYPFGGRLSEIP